MLSYNSQRVFIVFKNKCCSGSFGVVSRDRRLTRRFALCFTELLDDMLTAPFHHRFDLFFQGSTNWNKRRG
ncbi:hypothetical protein H5410_030508 [Solanum commersonii]|uniref:Uncharacterized protein n=1 Tax=Solanum commersonii TaxID=4109 RepID=A0A9J5YFV4_SOLCO|nr:hypothetical protein H5410_030508 [Solanum commersonii]